MVFFKTKKSRDTLRTGHNLMDKVNIDIPTVIKNTHNDPYFEEFKELIDYQGFIFYKYGGNSIYRYNKQNKEVVFFGYGRTCIIFKNKFFFFQANSIHSDRYIIQCNVDGTDLISADYKDLNLLSNKKVVDSLNHHVSQDYVSSMEIVDDTLIIRISRHEGDEIYSYYNITISETFDISLSEVAIRQ